MRRLFYAIGLAACGGSSESSGSRTAITMHAQSPTLSAGAEIRFATPESMTQVTCPDSAMRVDGVFVCPDEARAQGLTIIDLEDAWAPRLFAAQPDGTAPVFRETYLALAEELD